MTIVMIIEDNHTDAEKLRKILNELRSDLVFVLCEDGRDALEYLTGNQKKVDIFFVDRQLPQMDGFTLAGKIREMDEYLLTPIVFATGHEMGQLEAFQEYHCYSYILKPFRKETILQRIGTLLDKLTIGFESKQKSFKKMIAVHTRKSKYLLYTADILYLEMIGKDCCIHTDGQKYLIPRQSLTKQLEEIDESYFVRCHKSFAVNLLNVSYIQKKQRNIWTPVFQGELASDCEISKTYYDVVMECYRESQKRLQREIK